MTPEQASKHPLVEHLDREVDAAAEELFGDA